MSGAELRADLWVTEYITPWDVYLHGVTHILAHKRTPFQEMSIVESGVFGKALVLDGKWQSSTGDEFLYHEPLVHPAMIAHGNVQKVLVLGGGEGATVREILRWKSVRRVVMVDIDGDVVEECRKHLPEMHQGAFEDPRTELIVGDALVYLDDADPEWDVIISDLSDPIEEGPSFKLFTKEYFEKIARAMAPKGRLVIQAGPTSPSEVAGHGRLVKTLMSVFPHVRSFTSHTPSYGRPWGFALASFEPIDTRPDPAATDAVLAEKTTGGFRMMDGTTYLGLLQTQGHVTRAIANADRIYTLANPPKFFGSGVANRDA